MGSARHHLARETNQGKSSCLFYVRMNDKTLNDIFDLKKSPNYNDLNLHLNPTIYQSKWVVPGITCQVKLTKANLTVYFMSEWMNKP